MSPAARRPAPRRAVPSRQPSARPPRRRSAPGAARPPARTVVGLGGEQVEGRQSVLELLRAGRRPVRRILMADALDESPILDEIEVAARRAHAPLQMVSAARLDREAQTEGHQGVVAWAAPVRPVELAELLDSNAFLLVCDGVTDARNLGAMLRSADGAGVTGVIVPKHRSARLTPAVTKTAAGAIEYLRFAHVGGVPTAIEQLNRAGILTVGLDGSAPAKIYGLDLQRTPVALVVGGEQRGLSQLARRRCREVVALPQLGGISSLNASVAYSVAAYEVARQRDLH
jgi:23S rRNA (guanosine2251-2'-O)-methyltransferase